MAKRKWRRFHNLSAELDLVAGAVSGHRSRAWVPGSTPERGIREPPSWPV